MSEMKTPTPGLSGTERNVALIAVYSLFFIWGFIWALGGGVILPFFEKTMELSNTQKSYVPLASFAAFFIFSLPSKKIIDFLGPKGAMLTGLLLMAAGSAVMWPAAQMDVYYLALGGLFVAFAGITLLTVVATPYTAALGNPKTASSRINFGQGLGAVGATLAPFLGGSVVFELFGKTNPSQGMTIFFLALSGFLLLQVLVLNRLNLPAINPTEADTDSSPEANNQAQTQKNSALQYPHLVFAVVVLFLYMGAEAVMGNLLGPYLQLDTVGGYDKDTAGKLLTFFWGTVMLGRFAGSALLTKVKPGVLVGIFGAAAAALLVVSYSTTGMVSVVAVFSIGFFVSILYSTIFAMGIEGLGPHTNQGSSLCAMAISGGAVVPLLYGLLADSIGDIKTSFMLVLILPLALATLYGFWRAAAKKSKKMA